MEREGINSKKGIPFPLNANAFQTDRLLILVVAQAGPSQTEKAKGLIWRQNEGCRQAGHEQERHWMLCEAVPQIVIGKGAQAHLALTGANA